MNAVNPLRALLLLVLLLALAAASCALDLSPLRACQGDADCASSQVCAAGWCVAADADADPSPELPQDLASPDLALDLEPPPDLPPELPPRCTDGDGDGYARQSDDPGCAMPREPDECDAFATRNPAALETCDGLDNDCDGVIDNKLDLNPDEQPARLCPRQLGLCAGAARACVDGRYEGACADANYQAVFPEGVRFVEDEAFCGRPEGGAPRLDDKNRCRVAPAAPITDLASAEALLCDGFDNDCDGIIDDEEALRVPCFLDLTGADVFQAPTLDVAAAPCRAGVRVCAQGRYLPECQGQIEPAEDLCDPDMQDEDCDGEPNGGCPCVDGVAACYSGPRQTRGQGACQDGRLRCLSEGEVGGCEGEVLPALETCQDRNIDNDCDGDAADLDYDPDDPDSAILRALNGDIALGGACDTGAQGVCAAGRWSCVGVTYAICDPDTLPLGGDVGGRGAPQICNGLDDDCDGDIDEDADLTESPNCGACGVTCGANQGCCVPGLGDADDERACLTIRQADSVQGDPNNCGGCGADGDVFRCSRRQTCCGAACVDLTSDRAHCGACGSACGPGQICCDSRCVPLDSPTNCGGCASANPAFNCAAERLRCCQVVDFFTCLDVRECP